jgi:hypothetical protein
MAPEGAGGERKLIPLPINPTEGRQASFSPDDRWILYSSIQTGRREVFVEAIPKALGGPAASARQQVSIDGGSEPVWRADGKEIFYLALDGKMMAVSVEPGPCQPQAPRAQTAVPNPPGVGFVLPAVRCLR